MEEVFEGGGYFFFNNSIPVVFRVTVSCRELNKGGIVDYHSFKGSIREDNILYIIPGMRLFLASYFLDTF